jgi:hypothetical protein
MLGDNGWVRKFAYAQRRGEVTEALEYHSSSGPTHAAFSYLGRNIEEFFLTGVVPSPVERTYLTTGILEAALISRSRGGRLLATPHLGDIVYQATDRALRPSAPRPRGASSGPWPQLKPDVTPAAVAVPARRDGTVRGKRRNK